MSGTINSKGEFLIGHQEDKEGFPWWVKCSKCDRKHNVSNLSFCSIQCQECKRELVNPLHEPFHDKEECHAPIMENDSDYVDSQNQSDSDNSDNSTNPSEKP